MSVDEVQTIIAEADLNGDGKLDYAEFCHMLLNTSEECTRAHHNKASQVLKAKETHSYQAKSRNYQSPSYHINENRASFDRREKRREEIRMQLYSPTATSTIDKDSQIQDLDGELVDQNVVQGSPSSQPSPIPIASTATAELKNSTPPSSEVHTKPVQVSTPGTDPRVSSAMFPPLKKDPLPPLTNGEHSSSKDDGEKGRQHFVSHSEVSVESSSLTSRDETDKAIELQTGVTRQTDHLYKENKPATNDEGDIPGGSHDDQNVLTEQEPFGNIEKSGVKSQVVSSVQTSDSNREKVDSAESLVVSRQDKVVEELNSAEGLAVSRQDKGVPEIQSQEKSAAVQNGSLMNGKETREASKDVVAAIAAPPKKPKNIQVCMLPSCIHKVL